MKTSKTFRIINDGIAVIAVVDGVGAVEGVVVVVVRGISKKKI